MEEFNNLYDNFFKWCKLSEEEFLNNVKPKNKSIYYRGEWSSDYINLVLLSESVIKVLENNNFFNENFIDKVVFCLKIDSESEFLADKLFNCCRIDFLKKLIDKSIEMNCFEAQWQLAFRMKEIYIKFNDSNIDYISNFINSNFKK